MRVWIAFCVVLTVLVLGVAIWTEYAEKAECLESGGSWEVVGETLVATGKTFMMVDDYECVRGKR